MALVMAGRLADTSDMDHETCKQWASEMVGVWITFGFPYEELDYLFQVFFSPYRGI